MESKSKTANIEKPKVDIWKPIITGEKKALIVYAHPYDKSFCHAILESAIKGIEARKKPYEVIDLHKDGFNPRFDGKDLALFGKGTTTDPLARKYAELMLNSNEIIFIYPIWWGEKPAILKGFFDKSFLKDYFYEGRKFIFSYLWGKATWVKRVRVFTVCQTPKAVQWFLFCNSTKKTMVKLTLKALRMKGIKYTNFDRVTDKSKEKRVAFLGKVTRLCSRD